MVTKQVTVELPPFHPGQWMVYQSTARFKVVNAGRRFGKTWFAAVMCMITAVGGYPAWWIAPTYPMSREGWELLLDLTRDIPGIVVNKDALTLRFPGGGLIRVYSADKPDSIRGGKAKLIVFEEAALVDPKTWEIARPSLSDFLGGAIFISTPRGKNWYYKLYQRGQDPNEPEWESWQIPTRMNPFIDADEIEAARKDMDEKRFAQEYEADFTQNEGTFFHEWLERIHVCEPFKIPKSWTRWVSVDYGFADPCAIYWLARDPKTRRIYVYREVYRRSLRDEQQAKLIRELSKNEDISLYVGDPSMFNNRREANKPSISKVYQANGVPLVRASNARLPGWQIVRRALAYDDEDLIDDPQVRPRLQIFKATKDYPLGCTNLIRTLPEMVHDAVNSEDLADKINKSKTEDHAVDAIRYGLAAEQARHSKPTYRKYQVA